MFSDVRVPWFYNLFRVLLLPNRDVISKELKRYLNKGTVFASIMFVIQSNFNLFQVRIHPHLLTQPPLETLMLCPKVTFQRRKEVYVIS